MAEDGAETGDEGSGEEGGKGEYSVRVTGDVGTLKTGAEDRMGDEGYAVSGELEGSSSA